MGAPPKQHHLTPHDLASREKSPQHDQLNAEVSASGGERQARAPGRITLSVAGQNVTSLSRTAALLIVFFQLAYAAERRFTGASTLDATLSLILANVAIGVLFFLLTFTAAMPRYWR